LEAVGLETTCNSIGGNPMVSLVTNGDPPYKNSPISSKIERTIVIQTELIKALKEHGCPSCLEILKQVVEKYVGPSLPTAANPKTISNGGRPNDISILTRYF
jgi:hypothetical protein